MTSVTKQNGDLAGRFDLNAVLGNNKVGVMVNSEGSITGYCTITGNNFTLSFLVDAETGKFTGAVKYLSDNGSTSFLATVPQDLRNTSIEAFKVFANGSSVTMNLTREEGNFRYAMSGFSVRGTTNYSSATITAAVKPSNNTTVTFEAGPQKIYTNFISQLGDENDLNFTIKGSTDFQTELGVEMDLKLKKELPGRNLIFTAGVNGKVGNGIAFINVDGNVSADTTVNMFGIPVHATGGLKIRNLANQPGLDASVSVDFERTISLLGGEAGLRGAIEVQWDDLFNTRRSFEWRGGVYIFGRVRF
jgi:hypothetical protein